MTTRAPATRWRRLRAISCLGAGLGRAPRLLLAAAFAVIALMYACNDDMGGDPRSPRGDGRYRPVLARGDGHMTYLMLRSVVFDRDLDFGNDLQRFGDPWSQARTKTGRKGIPHPIGPVLVWAPLLAAAHGGALVANGLGANIQEHGYTLWHQRIVFASSVLFAWLAVGLAIWVFRRRVGGRWAPTWAAIAVLLGTSLTYYATYMPSYGHAMDAAASAGFLAAWALTLGRWDGRRLVLLGGLLGLAALVRSQELGLGIVVAVEVVATALGRPPEGTTSAWRWRVGLFARGAAVAAIALVVFAPQLIAWKIVYGDALALPQGPHYTRPGYPMIPELLFAARNGWFSTTPIAYAGVLGLVVLAGLGRRLGERARLLALGLLAAVAVQIYLNSIIYDWWGNASFGARRLCSMTLPVTIGLATWLFVLGRAVARLRVPRLVWHGVAVLVLGWFVAWNLAWISPLGHGRAADRRAGPICCQGVPRPLAALATPVYRAIGNPFSLPASAVFGWRYRLPWRRWDEVQGEYPFAPNMDYTAETMRSVSADWDLGSGRVRPWIVRGFGRPAPGPGRSIRWTTAPRALTLVPVLVPEAHRASLWLVAARPGQTAVVRWNDRIVFRGPLGAQPTTVDWMIAGEVGLQELVIESEVAPAAAELGGVPVPSGPVGVAVGVLRFSGS